MNPPCSRIRLFPAAWREILARQICRAARLTGICPHPALSLRNGNIFLLDARRESVNCQEGRILNYRGLELWLNRNLLENNVEMESTRQGGTAEKCRSAYKLQCLTLNARHYERIHQVILKAAGKSGSGGDDRVPVR